MHGCVVLLVLAATILRVVCFFAYNQQEHFDNAFNAAPPRLAFREFLLCRGRCLYMSF